MMLLIHRIVTALALNVLSWLLYGLILFTLYFAFIRDLQMNWGATSEEITQAMMGDILLEEPDMNATRAIEIKAGPEEIWPWIVQIGYRRGGFYGFDNLDNGGCRSSDTILLQYQDLQVGDSIPGGEYKGQAFYILEVVGMEPGQEMAWIFLKDTPWAGATWSWKVYGVDHKKSRLVSRLRHKYSFDSFQSLVAWSVIDAIEILMMRTTMRGIKMRAERISAAAAGR
ncbi:MAG: hypothetical protein GWO41_05520 [candidate division Zixibacteria bacterium]|nr:hypothetical protein [candidate division Zixibacteria bacterium]NIT52205.1 hypothetical protein [candidate division Zixibacteria bacterium]NIW40198.1 hypothetical protein [candidate division Zixibacteria bacterium]NIX57312.1 hypothetical protein [candidate division Zixibacteria bacterium]